MSTYLKSVILQTKKHEKAGKKPGTKGAKKAAAGGPKARARKTQRKEDFKEKDKSLMVHVS